MNDTTIRTAIGARIRELRLSRGLTQQQLADLSHLSKPNISNIEAGKYSVGIDVLQRICQALNVTLQLVEKD